MTHYKIARTKYGDYKIYHRGFIKYYEVGGGNLSFSTLEDAYNYILNDEVGAVVHISPYIES